MHAFLSQGTVADASPAIQHCPLVLTAILDFMAAFCMHSVALPGQRKTKKHREQEPGSYDVALSIPSYTYTGNPSI